MVAVSKDIAIKFCGLCNWVYEAWLTHRFLFHENETPDENIGKARAFTVRLSTITQEYTLQQIAKLHDPATQGKSNNLTIDFIVRFWEWGEQQDTIDKIAERLSHLWTHLKLARNKVLAHADLETVIADTPLGAFPEGMDDNYFDALQELVNEVHKKWVGSPYTFNDRAKKDTVEFLAVLERA